MPLRFAEPADETYDYPLTIRHLLDGVESRASEALIVYRDQLSFTYPELVGRIGRLAGMLTRLGAEQGTIVAIMDWDSHRYLEAYFAVPMMGAVLQTVNVRMAASQIAYALKHAGAEIVMVHRDFYGIIEAIRPDLPGVRFVGIADGNEEASPLWAVGEYEAFTSREAPDFPFEDFDENALATTFYTSGTTGAPKAVSFTHRQLVLQALASSGHLAVSEVAPSFSVGDVYMPLTPMFHVHAWGIPYLATLLGVKQVYPGRYEPKLICWLRDAHDVTYSHCVPTVLEMILDAADQTGTDLTGWKMTIGGAALIRTLWERARARGLIVAAGYGMSETGPLVSRAALPGGEHPVDQAAAFLCMAGTTFPLVKARIVDEAMNDVPHDGRTAGELVLRAPWLTSSYAHDADGSMALWRGGWLHTQDIATIDHRGRIQIRDRLKDVIKTGGEWVDSLRIEELVAMAEGVREVAVIAISDMKWGERPLAVVVVAEGAKPTLAALNLPIDDAIADQTLTRFARLDSFEIVDSLPRTSVGKIDKKSLRARFAHEVATDRRASPHEER